MDHHDDAFLNVSEAARFLGLSTHTLNCWRSRDRGPAYCKLGSSVRYRASDLRAFADAQRREPAPSAA